MIYRPNDEWDEYRILTKAPQAKGYTFQRWPGAGPWSSLAEAQHSIGTQHNSLVQGFKFKIECRKVRSEATEWQEVT